MQVINILIALIVAIGFCRRTTKEQERKTANATIIKCFIFITLTLFTLFFYYKSYQVATFKNYISIKGYKGSYVSEVDKIDFNGSDLEIERVYSNDVVKGLFLVSRFSKEEIAYNDPIDQIIHSDSKSGFCSYCAFANTKGIETKLYPDIDTLDILRENSNIKHLYDISLYTNTIPSIFPFSAYEENYVDRNNLDYENDPEFSFVSAKVAMLGKNLEKGKDYDRMLLSRYITYYTDNDASNPLYLKSKNSTETINTLNFFSAADLSQCIYEIYISSDIPIEVLELWFDIPVEINSLDVVRDNVSSRTFTVKDLRRTNGKVEDFRHYHVKFPTLSNLQLIRALILTTLLTALLSMTFTNCYYYCRKVYKRRLRKKPITLASKRKMHWVWIPVGKILVWSAIAVFLFMLIRTMTNNYYSIDLKNVVALKWLCIVIAIAYIVIVSLIMNFLYKKKIYLGKKEAFKIWEKIVSCLRKLYFFVKKTIPMKWLHLNKSTKGLRSQSNKKKDHE